jgi:predicted O-linked N-acetylglucosamine transferase (SPINDLY family)
MPEVSPLPARTSGYLTFISRNTFAKASEPALEVWAKIFAQTGNSRLILTAPEGSARTRVRQGFEKHGIAPQRIEFTGRGDPWASLIDSYARADIALDPFPYCGWITSCDALWMGLPVVTLRGGAVMGRGGCSTLANLGLSDLTAESPEQYVEIASSLAHDLPRLTQLRTELRARMQSSPLRAPNILARDIEAAYRKIWRRWCEEESE